MWKINITPQTKRKNEKINKNIQELMWVDKKMNDKNTFNF